LYILWSFSNLVCCTKKNLATLNLLSMCTFNSTVAENRYNSDVIGNARAEFSVTRDRYYDF
jgi:hypothetical protein